MNQQGTLIDGVWKGGIEWTRWRETDGTIQPGYTWNPIGGCEHDCEWLMPGGWVECYAKTVAERAAQRAYRNGFKFHYWRPHLLQKPTKLHHTAGIFLDSMSDLMGANVPAQQIEQILDVCRQCYWHRFFLLTKNAPRLLKFRFPSNVIVGVSMPPTKMRGRILNDHQRTAYVRTALKTLAQIDVPVRWMSFEPLSFDVAPLVAEFPGALQWAVIGAASNGATKYQPDPDHMTALLEVLAAQSVPVFFKGNVKWDDWYENYPVHEVKRYEIDKELDYKIPLVTERSDR